MVAFTPHASPRHRVASNASPRRRVAPHVSPRALSAVAALSLLYTGSSTAHAESLSAVALKRLSLDQLFDIDVVSVSKRPERLAEAASAIQVISGEDIRRSGASSLPEALRLVSNLQVAQVNASQWAISARGFNNVLANKLLVQIDGRSVYTPLYAGVFWDVQDVLLADIERIEVVSGPGGTMWGANAVNGVINVITKHASKTEGLRLEGGAGTELNGGGSVRQGGTLGPGAHYRAYGKARGTDSTVLLDGSDAADGWPFGQGGFRIDWERSERDALTLQADAYGGTPDPKGGEPIDVRGGNAVGRWSRQVSTESNLQVQAYFDHTWRDFNNGLREGVDTYDLEAQHSFAAGARHDLVWGLGIRYVAHEVDNNPAVAFVPAHKSLPLYSAFVQDEISLLRKELRLTLGSKIEHNAYTGFEPQPTVRLAWVPSEEQTYWGAVSRAVRTPSRLDRDFVFSAAPGVVVIAGSPDFISEEVVSYELGSRLHSGESVVATASTFYNVYDGLRTAEPGPAPSNLPILIGNGVEGETYGIETTLAYQFSSRWRVRTGYTFLRKELSVKESSHDLNRGSAESDDPEHQALLHSSLNLPERFEFDTIVRYVDALQLRPVESYVGLDLRLGWRGLAPLELVVVGQDILESQHQEFVPSSPSPREIERAFLVKAIWQM